MEQFYTLLTDIGKAKIANTAALQKKLELSKIVLGDSKGAYYEPTEQQTQLKNKVCEGEISDKFIDKDNPNWIVVQTIIPSQIGGFTIREAGIVDTEGDLIVVAKYPETYKPKVEDGSTKDITINLILEVSNVENVTLKVDPTIIFATKKDIENVKKEVAENTLSKEDVQTTIENIKASDIKTSSGATIESQLADITKQIDNIDLSADKVTLNSSNIKSKNVKGALEELFTSASNGKNKIVTAITGKGIVANNTDSFDTLSNKIKQIPTYAPANLLVEVNRSPPIIPNEVYDVSFITLDNNSYIYCVCTKVLIKMSENGTTFWKYKHDEIIQSVAVKNGYVYIGTWDNHIIKMDSSSGNIIWNNYYSSRYGIYSIVIDNDDIIYAGTENKKVIKIDSTGNVIWTYDKHKSDVYAITIDKNGYIYSGGGGRLVKLCSNGGEEWIQDFDYNITSIAIDNNGYIYIGFNNRGIAKINPDNGEQIWDVNLDFKGANAIYVDDYVYVASYDKIIRKISLDGLEIWKYYCDYSLRSIIKKIVIYILDIIKL